MVPVFVRLSRSLGRRCGTPLALINRLPALLCHQPRLGAGRGSRPASSSAGWAGSGFYGGVHDVGGEPSLLKVPISIDSGADAMKGRDHQLWEKRVHALLVILAQQGHVSTDSLRRAIEALPEASYKSFSYYGRSLSFAFSRMRTPDPASGPLVAIALSSPLVGLLGGR